MSSTSLTPIEVKNRPLHPAISMHPPRTPLRAALVLAFAAIMIAPRLLGAAEAIDNALPSSKAADPRRVAGDFGRIAAFGSVASAPGRLRFQPTLDGTVAAQSYSIGSNRLASVFPATDEIALVLQPGASAATLSALSTRPWPVESLSPGAFARISGQREILVLRSKQPGQLPNSAQLLLLNGVLSTKPVHADPKSGLRLVATDELLIRLKPEVALSNVVSDLNAAGTVVVGPVGASRLRCFQLRLLNPLDDAFATARRLQDLTALEWATPNFVREIRRSFVPNDPLFSRQQHLRNTGQQGGVPGADIGAVDAWDQSRGTNRVVIAILDDGVDLAHADLKIRLNPGESGGGKETNGIDDDGDGFIDDYRGWNFAAGNNNPAAVGGNGHGTACAGIAAASLNNGVGGAGLAGNCTILPVKIIDDDGDFTTDSNIGAAFSFASAQASIVSCSWELGATSAFIDAALHDAATAGRNGLGCPVFIAAGNQASGWQRLFVPVGQDLGSGTFAFGFIYDKDDNTSLGDDVARLDDVLLLDGDGYTHLATALGPGGHQNFEGTFPPPGWSLASSGGAFWGTTTNGAFSGTQGTRSARSGLIGHGQFTEIRTPNLTLAGDEQLVAQVYVSSETAFDGLIIRVYDGSGTVLGDYGILSGIPTIVPGVSYPANHPDAISVGASTDTDQRAEYSQFGPELDFLAPSDGGWNAITTTDVTGNPGLVIGDDLSNFGGTSAATPLAAGAGALLLTVNSNLTATLVRDILRANADKVGPIPYVGGFNQQYGYGRLNIRVALQETEIPVITVVASDASAAEPANPGTFTLSRSGALTKTLTVNFSFAGSATAGSDFINISNSITFAIGSSITNLTLNPIDDNVVEPAKTVILNLGEGAGYTIGDPASASIDLADNDSTVTVTASDSVAGEPANLGTLIFTRTAPLSSSLTVNFVLSGTATPGADYSSVGTNITFTPNSGTAQITIAPIDDLLAEPQETAILTLSDGTGYAIGSPSSATVTLNDNDPPTITVTATDATASEPSNPGVFTFSRTGPTTSPITAQFSVSGSASAGSDYATLPSSITFASGAASTNLVVSPIDDAAIEDPESIALTLTPFAGYLVGSPSNAVVTLNDDDTPFVSVAVADNTASEPGSNTAAFSVFRVGSTLAPVTVNFALSGSASNGVDFSFVPASVIIPAGATSAPVVISPVDNSEPEDPKSVILSLSTGSGYLTNGVVSAELALIDNDVVSACPPGVLALDGIDDFASVGASLWPTNIFPASFTVEAWIYPRSLSGLRFVAADDAFDFTFGSSALNHVLYGPSGLFSSASLASAPIANSWNHVAITFDGNSRQLRAALNGVLSSPVSFPESGFYSDNAQHLTLGARRLSPKASPEGFFHGEIDEVRFSSSVRYTANFKPQVRFNADASTRALYHFDESAGATSFADTSGASRTLFGFSGAQAAALPSPGSENTAPVAHWRFDENAGATAADASGNGNEGLLINGPSWDPNGQAGGCLSFDGLNDLLTVSNSPALELGKNNTDFSVAFWVNLQQGFNGSWRTLMHKGEGTNRTFALYLHPNANRIHYRISTLANWNEGSDSVGVLSTNTWTHVALIKSGSAYRLYLNGVLDSQRILPSPVVHNSLPFYVGSHPSTPPTKAKFDDLRLYCRALSDLELYDVRALVAHWRFAEGSGAVAQDASPYNNDAFLGPVSTAPSWTANGSDAALSFDGVDDILTVPDAPSIQLGKNNADFSVTFWLRLLENFNGNWRALMQKGEGTNRTFSLFLHPNANRIHYRISTLANWNEGFDSVGVLTTNTWTHVALLKSGSAYRLYFNGVLDSQRILPSPVVHNTFPLYIGDHPALPATKAILDDVRLYADDLPPAVLSSLIAQPLNQPIPSPFDTPVLLPADLASNASSTSKSELALASVRPNDPASAVPPRLTLSLDTASGQLLLQQVLDPANRPTDWTWELSDDLIHWSPAPPPALATSADGLPVLQLRLPQAANTTRFFRARSN